MISERTLKAVAHHREIESQIEGLEEAIHGFENMLKDKGDPSYLPTMIAFIPAHAEVVYPKVVPIPEGTRLKMAAYMRDMSIEERDRLTKELDQLTIEEKP